MAFPDTPNRLESVFIQRDTTNERYDQINVSGSNLIVYLNSSGSIDADKIDVWCNKYSIPHGSSSVAPSNPSTPVGWGILIINGSTFKFPLYQ